LLATVKTKQVMARLSSTDKTTVERRMRLRESRILEMSFGIFMVILYVLPKVGSKILPSFNLGSTIFFGTLFGLYFAVLSTIVMVTRVLTNKAEINDYLRDYLGNVEVRGNESNYRHEDSDRYDVCVSHTAE